MCCDFNVWQICHCAVRLRLRAMKQLDLPKILQFDPQVSTISRVRGVEEMSILSHFRGCLASMRSNSSKFESNSPREHKKPDLFCFVSSWTTPLKNYKRNNRTAAEIEKKDWVKHLHNLHTYSFSQIWKNRSSWVQTMTCHLASFPLWSCASSILQHAGMLQKEDFKKLPRYGAYPRTVLMGKGW